MITQKLQKTRLFPHHQTQLYSESCINEAVMDKAMLFSGDREFVVAALGSPQTGIVFPYFDLSGEAIGCRLRLDTPFEGKDGRPVRYLQKKNSSLTCYFIKDDISKLNDLSVPLWITEGEKKLLSIASLPDSDNVAIVSYPGCNNWTEKGTGKLSVVWSSIPLSGRSVLWIPDSDYFTNSKVRKAGDRFLKLIVQSGAKVSVVTLIDERTSHKKYGADDFIKTFGSSAFLKKCRQPLWQFSDELSKDAHISCRQLAHLLPIEFGKYVESISKKSQIEIGQILSIWKQHRSTWNKLRGLSDHESEFYEIDISDGIPRQKIIQQVSQLLRVDGRFYRYGTEFLMIKKDEKELIDATTMPGRLNSLGIEFTKPIKESVKYELFPVSLSRALLQSTHATSGLPEISLFTNHPTYDRDWQMSSPGYNPSEKTYYSGEKIIPIKSQEHLSYIIRDFLLRNDASRCNLVALLLTAILRNKYRGDRPFGALTGNRPGIGKSLASRIVAIVAEGSYPETITYTRNQDEFEKSIGARLVQRDVVFVDNIKSNTPVDSPVLERLITDDPISFRKLGFSQTITRPNTSIVLMTMNQATFCQDLISRLLPIEFFLQDGQEPAQKNFSTDTLADYVKQNRTFILQELCGMIEVWKEKGCPPANREFRFRQWAKEIGGILEVNGFGAFLTNLHTAQSEYNKDTSGLSILFRNHLEKAVSSEELLRVCQQENLFPEIVNSRGPAIALAHLLSRHLNKKITLSDGSHFTLINGPMDKHRKVKTYVADLSQVPCGGTDICGDVELQEPRLANHCLQEVPVSFAGTAGTKTNLPNSPGQKSEYRIGAKTMAAPCKEPASPAKTANPSSTEVSRQRGQMQGPCGDAGNQIELSLQMENEEMKGNDLNW